MITKTTLNMQGVGAESVSSEYVRSCSDNVKVSNDNVKSCSYNTLSGTSKVIYTKYTKDTKDTKDTAYTKKIKDTKYTAISSLCDATHKSKSLQDDIVRAHGEDIVGFRDEPKKSVPSKPKSLNDNITQSTVQMLHDGKRGSKRKLNIQLLIDKQWLKFTCNLTTDMTNFRKFNDNVVNYNDQINVINTVNMLKQNFINNPSIIQKGHNIYVGKIRPISSYVSGLPQMTEIIPDTFCLTYFNCTTHTWHFVLHFKDFELAGEFSKSKITKQQKEVNIIGQYFYYKNNIQYKNDYDKLKDMGF